MSEETGHQPITMRLQAGTWQALRRLARRHQRSLNSEINWALGEYVRRAAPEGQQTDDHDDRQDLQEREGL